MTTIVSSVAYVLLLPDNDAFANICIVNNVDADQFHFQLLTSAAAAAILTQKSTDYRNTR